MEGQARSSGKEKEKETEEETHAEVLVGQRQRVTLDIIHAANAVDLFQANMNNWHGPVVMLESNEKNYDIKISGLKAMYEDVTFEQ